MNDPVSNSTILHSYETLPFSHGTNYSVPSVYELLHPRQLRKSGHGVVTSPHPGHESQAEDEPPRNPRSASAHKFRHHHKIRFQLYSANAELLVALLPNGTVALTNKQNNPNTFFNIQPVLMTPYTTRFRSITTGIFMCMDRRGRLYTSCNYSSECEFLHKMEKTYYTTLESKSYTQRYITISHDGRIRRSKRQRKRPLLQDHFFLELKISVMDTDRLLRRYYGHEPNAVLQHCASYSPEFENEIRESSSFASSPKQSKHKPETVKNTKGKKKGRRKCKTNQRFCLGRKRKRCKSRRCALKRKRKRQKKLAKLAQKKERERIAALSNNRHTYTPKSKTMPKNVELNPHTTHASQTNFRSTPTTTSHPNTTPISAVSSSQRHRLHTVSSRKSKSRKLVSQSQSRRRGGKRRKTTTNPLSNDILPSTTTSRPPFRWTPSQRPHKNAHKQHTSTHKIRHLRHKPRRLRRKKLRGHSRGRSHSNTRAGTLAT